MKNLVKRALLILVGLCFLLAALAFGLILIDYVAEGAGLQFFGLGISSGSILLGLVHVVGFCTAALICFVIGIVLCASGFVSGPKQKNEGRTPSGNLFFP